MNQRKNFVNQRTNLLNQRKGFGQSKKSLISNNWNKLSLKLGIIEKYCNFASG